MDKNYYELIVESAAKSDWANIIRLATEASFDNKNVTVFGIKKGFLNVFEGSYKNLATNLKEAGYTVFFINKQIDATKAIRDGIITPQLIADNFVIVICDRASAIMKLASAFSLNLFSLNADSIGIESTKYVSWTQTLTNGGTKDHYSYRSYETIINLTNKKTMEKYVFNSDTNVFKALSRENRIDKIFED
jgi:hypothetical protein